MKSKPQSPIWPYLGILACLFVLSITAPRAWERMARKQTLSQILATRKARQTTSREAATRQWPTPIDNVQRKADESDATESNAAPAPSLPNDPTQPIEQPTASLDPPGAKPTVVPPNPSMVPPTPEYALEVAPLVDVGDEASTSEPSDDGEPIADPDPKGPDYEPVMADSTWPPPRALLEQLEGVVHADSSATWASQAIDLIGELCRNVDQQGRTPTEILTELRSVLPRRLTAPDGNRSLEAQLIRTQYALGRWLDVWEPAALLDETKTADVVVPVPSDHVAQSLLEVEAILRQDSSGPAWRDYLCLDELHRFTHDPSATPEQRRTLARRVLDRLASPNLTQAQRKLVKDGPIAILQTDLRPWAAEPVGSTRLLAHLDKYEQSSLPSDARLVANDWRGLSWQSTNQADDISRNIATHYRNANIRLALSGELLNRWVPQPEAVESSVRDRIMNVPVRGRNTTFTEMSVRLVPDPRRIRVGLEANGLIASSTVATSGPARLYNRGQSTFLVRKLFVLGPEGLAVWPAVAEAENNYNYLVSVETGFDGVPLVGSLVRRIARSQHDELAGEARFAVEQKVAIRARDQFDEQIRPRLTEAAENIEKNQMATLRHLGLELAPVGLSTSEERIVARVRLASPEQLGAHTPRPRAPSDSWASLQIHESALNNGLQSLDLDGRTFTLDELFRWIAAKLNRPDLENQEGLPEGVRLTFADKDAVHLKCNKGRIDIWFSFAALKQGRKRWHDFTVHSYYVPQRQGLTPRFVRDKGTIFLEGKSLRGKPHIALRMIFSRVLSLNRDIDLIGESITTDPRVEDLEISQFVVEHGWIGLAYSPTRTPRNVAR